MKCTSTRLPGGCDWGRGRQPGAGCGCRPPPRFVTMSHVPCCSAPTPAHVLAWLLTGTRHLLRACLLRLQLPAAAGPAGPRLLRLCALPDGRRRTQRQPGRVWQARVAAVTAAVWLLPGDRPGARQGAPDRDAGLAGGRRRGCPAVGTHGKGSRCGGLLAGFWRGPELAWFCGACRLPDQAACLARCRPACRLRSSCGPCGAACTSSTPTPSMRLSGSTRCSSSPAPPAWPACRRQRRAPLPPPPPAAIPAPAARQSPSAATRRCRRSRWMPRPCSLTELCRAVQLVGRPAPAHRAGAAAFVPCSPMAHAPDTPSYFARARVYLLP